MGKVASRALIRRWWVSGCEKTSLPSTVDWLIKSVTHLALVSSSSPLTLISSRIVARRPGSDLRRSRSLEYAILGDPRGESPPG